MLDILQERAGVNALLLANPTWTRGTGGRQVPGQPFPDHGRRSRTTSAAGPTTASTPAGTARPPSPRVRPHRPGDPRGLRPLRGRAAGGPAPGIRSYAWMEESSNSRHLHAVPNFTKALEVDVWGRPSNKPCFRNPDYRWWIRGRMEDYARTWPLDGIVWCSERTGPLNHLIGNRSRYTARNIACFCEHCQRRSASGATTPAGDRRATAALYEWYERAGRGERPADGYFVTFWRLLLAYPEILAWEKLWSDGQHQLSREIYGTVKAADPAKEVGVHVYHELSFSPWYRAEEDYADLKRYHDWLKIGDLQQLRRAALPHFVENLCRALFADATPAEVYPLMLRLLNLEEAPFEELPPPPASPRTTCAGRRSGRCGGRDAIPIYPGIDIDIPTAADESKCTPEGVRDAVKAAFAGGARGVVLSRKYSEMRLDNLGAPDRCCAASGCLMSEPWYRRVMRWDRPTSGKRRRLEHYDAAWWWSIGSARRWGA